MIRIPFATMLEKKNYDRKQFFGYHDALKIYMAPKLCTVMHWNYSSNHPVVHPNSSCDVHLLRFKKTLVTPYFKFCLEVTQIRWYIICALEWLTWSIISWDSIGSCCFNTYRWAKKKTLEMVMNNNYNILNNWA